MASDSRAIRRPWRPSTCPRAHRRGCIVLTWFAMLAVAHPGWTWADEQDESPIQIERMTPLEKEHLRRKQDRFAKFSSDAQQRMRQLYDDLQRDPHGDELRQLMIRYHEWLDTLEPSQRVELAELPSDQRIARIEQFNREQDAHRAKEMQEAPTYQDLQTILRWTEEFAWRHREALLAGLSAERQKYLGGLEEAQQRRAMLPLLVHRWNPNSKPEPVLPSEADLADLVGRLSPAAQQRLQQAKSPQDRANLIREWMQAANRHREVIGGIRKILPSISPGELRRFFRQELTAEQREALLQLSADQMYRVLLRLYFQPAERLAQLHPGGPNWPEPMLNRPPRGNRPLRPNAPGGPARRPGPQGSGSNTAAP